MPRRKTATNSKATEVQQTAEDVKKSVDTQTTPSTEVSENKLKDSKVENPVMEIKKTRFNYNWIRAIFALIFVGLFIVYFGNIKNFFIADESQTYFRFGLLIAVVVVLLIWYLPKRQVNLLQVIPLEKGETKFDRAKERIKLEDETRKTLAQIIGGALLLAGLVFTYQTLELNRQSQELSRQNQEISRESQITERFSKAVELLKSEDVSVRIGGLYALERVAKDSPKDHPTIMEVLASYIHERSNKTNSLSNQEKQLWIREMQKKKKTGVLYNIESFSDILVAVTILHRRNVENDKSEIILNMSDAFLPGVTLREAKFKGVNLFQAYLEEADLSESDLTNANLEKAELQNANLTGANLTNAKLASANLTATNLRKAILNGANFYGANLHLTKLRGADLSNCVGLTFEQLTEAFIVDDSIILPKDLAPYRAELVKASNDRWADILKFAPKKEE